MPIPEPTPAQVEAVASALRGRRWVALTGAGISTDSGIPDYRGPESRPTNPIQYRDFIGRPEARRRYWFRSMMGFRSFGAAHPNPGHQALAALGVPVITQNVDRLHSEAGSREVVDLHGLINRVICLDCGDLSSRATLQTRLEDANPGVTGVIPAGSAELRPDGDADIADPDDFVVPPCSVCGGMLKPDVVFFGENVAQRVLAQAWQVFEEGDVLLVAGSSLTVYSGRRFIDRATRDGLPIAVVNRGPTRADDVAVVKVDGTLGLVLPALAAALDGSPVRVRAYTASVPGVPETNV